MPGSGVNSKNIKQLATQTKTTEFHSSARIPVETRMDYEVKTMNEALTFMGVDEAEVLAMKQVLQSLQSQ